MSLLLEFKRLAVHAGPCCCLWGGLWFIHSFFLQKVFQIFFGSVGTLKVIKWCWCFQGIWLSLAHSLEYFLTCHCKTPSHPCRGEGLTAAHCHSHVLFPSPQVLLMLFHYQLILILLVALLSNSESHQWHWWVMSLFAQNLPDRSDAPALAPGRLRQENWPMPLGIPLFFPSYGLAINSIVC